VLSFVLALLPFQKTEIENWWPIIVAGLGPRPSARAASSMRAPGIGAHFLRSAGKIQNKKSALRRSLEETAPQTGRPEIALSMTVKAFPAFAGAAAA
jgi:hypothetical protein